VFHEWAVGCVVDVFPDFTWAFTLPRHIVSLVAAGVPPSAHHTFVVGVFGKHPPPAVGAGCEDGVRVTGIHGNVCWVVRGMVVVVHR
jgi:hypothetical protein